MAGPLLVLTAVCAVPQQKLNMTLNKTQVPQMNCSAYTDCMSCASAPTWSGAHCRWCPLKNDMQCHDEGSIFNKCSEKEQITDPVGCPGAPGNMPHQPMSDDLQSRAKVRVLEAFSAYCTGDAITNWNCKFCTQLDSKYTVTAYASNQSQHSAAFVAYTTSPEKRIVISFRGTDGADIKNWIENVNFVPTPIPWLDNPNYQAHEGFVGIYVSLRPHVQQGLKDAQAACPDCNVSVVGHSLGGAVAVLAASDLVVTNKIVPQVFTFGAPRSGNGEYHDWYRANVHDVVGSYRAVHKHDIVPHVPTNTMGFLHMPREIWQTNDTNYEMCDNTGEDHLCSWGVGVTDYSINDHFRYFDIDEGC
eukprot:Hpha_TRINITY_DN16266_c3_g5::TRINITY_DN16266_c3_g5_i1::g.11645::m.11645